MTSISRLQKIICIQDKLHGRNGQLGICYESREINNSLVIYKVRMLNDGNIIDLLDNKKNPKRFLEIKDEHSIKEYLSGFFREGNILPIYPPEFY